jgi:hypothetical protein
MEDNALDISLRQAILAAEPGLEEKLETDRDAYLRVVSLSAQANARVPYLLNSAVTAARTAGHSWARVGKELGMTRQAAQQRFSINDTIPAEFAGTVKKLQPLTAFDEMEALERAGREGWHSISFGMLYHLVEKTDEQWQHLRVLATSSRSSLEADGWRRIGRMWFPWAYYARNTGRKAELSPDGIE